MTLQKLRCICEGPSNSALLFLVSSAKSVSQRHHADHGARGPTFSFPCSSGTNPECSYFPPGSDSRNPGFFLLFMSVSVEVLTFSSFLPLSISLLACLLTFACQVDGNVEAGPSCCQDYAVCRPISSRTRRGQPGAL